MDLSAGFLTKAGSIANPRPRALRALVRWAALIGLAAALVAGSLWLALRPIEVTGSPVGRGKVVEVVYATGVVEPDRPVDVSSRVTAPVTAVLADEGDRVERGQALAALDAEDQRQAIVQLDAARVKAEQDEARAFGLYRGGWMAKAGRDEAVAAATSARAAEASARAKLDQYVIRSGISGVVLRRDVEPGSLATAARTLFEIGDPTHLRVTATVDERDIPLVRNKASVLMSSEAFPGHIVRGQVYEITPGGNPDQRAFRVRIRPEAGVSLPVGLTLEVNILAAERAHALLVPPGAIRDNGLWVANHGRARHLAVEEGIRGSDRTEVRRGLNDGACVISDPPASLKEGTRLKVMGC